MIGVRSQVIPIAEIKSARATQSSTKHGTAYRVTLVTTSGDVDVGAGSYDRARINAVNDINAFLRSKTSPSIDIVCETANSNNTIIAASMSVLLHLSRMAAQSIRARRNQLDSSSKEQTVSAIRALLQQRDAGGP